MVRIGLCERAKERLEKGMGLWGFNEKETMALMKRRLKWKTFFLYLIWVFVLGVFVQDKLRP